MKSRFSGGLEPKATKKYSRTQILELVSFGVLHLLKFPAPSHCHFQNRLFPTCRRSTTRGSTRAFWCFQEPRWCDLGRKHNMTCHFCSLSVSHLFMISPRGPPLPVDSEAGRNLPQVFEEMHLLNLIGFFWRVKPHPKTSPSKLKIHWRTWWEHRYCFAGFLRNVLGPGHLFGGSHLIRLRPLPCRYVFALCCSQSLHGSRFFRHPKWLGFPNDQRQVCQQKLMKLPRKNHPFRHLSCLGRWVCQLTCHC